MLASAVLVLGMCSASYHSEVQCAILEATENLHFESVAFESDYSEEVQAAMLEAVEVWK